MQGASPAPPRREEALAYIVERIVRSGTSPSYAEIGKAMRPRVGITRVRDLINELTVLGVIDRDPGSQRGIRIRDVSRCRSMIEGALGIGGWWHASPLGSLTPPDGIDALELPLMPAFEHLPDPD